MDESELDIRPGTPMDVTKASKGNLVLLHEEMRRQKELQDKITRNSKILCGIRLAMEAALGIDHPWDLSEDYDPNDPPQKREEDDPLKRLFGG